MDEKNVLPAHLRTKLLEAVLKFMGRCGVTEAAIRESFEVALTESLRREEGVESRRRAGLYIKTQNLPAQILRVWHRDDRYLDQEARPRPLLLMRGRLSLRSAIKRIDPSVDVAKVLRGMKTAGLIRRTSHGRYLPTSESAIIGQLHPLLVEHVAKSVNRLISTVCRNTDPTGRSLSLVDRHAYTSDMNPAERVAFAEFTRSHGMAYLESIDDWLEKRRMLRTPTATSKGVKGVAAGVYLFAYLGDDEAADLPNMSETKSGIAKERSKIAAKSPRAKKTTPPREARA